tara:strand:- start:3 stop:941 length:939 start_codon:yes stop_codon:yes gene_type:complete
MKSILSITSFLLIISYGSAQVPNYVPSDSLIGWWGFNGNANDESGNGNNGTVNGATLTTDRFGNTNSAYDFDGMNDNIIIDLLFDEPTRSFFAWFSSNGSTGADQIIMTNDYGLLTHGMSSMTLLTDQTFFSQTGSLPCVSQTLTFNTWHHAGAVRYSDSTMFYLDGNLLCTITNGNINSTNPYAGLKISGSQYSSADRFFFGQIDDIGIWNRALDSCKVKDLYNASVNCTVGLSNQSTSKPKIFPNPTNENLSISLENFNGNINTEVYDLIGNKLQTTDKTTISLIDYSKGIYILKVAYGNRVEEVKVIKD